MADPYYPYVSPALPDGVSASIPRTSFAGYIPAEAPSLASPHVSNSTGLRGVGSDYFQKDVNLLRMGAYGIDGTLVGSRVHSEASVVPTGHNTKGYSPLEDPDLSKNRDTPLAINPAVADISNERPVSKSDYDGLPNSAGESNILFVGGLPNDCTRREVGHLFRPFIGYKDIRVVHKEPRRSGDKAMTLCFVEFVDSKCALTAMEALQGYRFDDKKPDSLTLKIQFAHFPFHLPPDHGQQTAAY